MAKKLRFNYTFTPGAAGAGTVVLSGNVSQKRLLLITNVSKNVIIYNFSDPTLGATSYIYNSVTNQTTITLAANTSTQSSADNLQIFHEEDAATFQPTEHLYDAVNKLRTSSPQALIDIDFEYGTQTSKWENLALVNNRPLAYPSPVGVGTINYITIPTNSRSVSIGLQNNNFGVVAGNFISVTDTFLNIANGVFVVDSVSGAGSTIINYTAKSVNTTTLTSIADLNKTGITTAIPYFGCAIGAAPTFAVNGVGYAVTVTTTVPHGLSIGNNIAVTGITGTNPPNGTFSVAQIQNPTTFTYFATNGVPSALTTTGASLYVRPNGQVLHRPFDGGCLFSTNSSSNYEVMMRQTRRYFRYQSGKAIQVSTGTCLKPDFMVDGITSSGTTVTVQTKEQHNIQPGTTITVFGCNETAYNGTFVVTAITGYNTFQYTALSTPSNAVASGQYSVSVVSWYGAQNRLGIFDQQNGLFWEFDGTTLYAVRRSSIYQISGKVSVNNGSNTVTQTSSAFPTYFTKQLNVGDSIVIRGQSYRVIEIASDTSLTINPSYRGSSVTNTQVTRTVELRIPQSQFNLDTIDGNGPSGYNIDVSKLQMYYIDYTWYGAGFIRWGVRGPDGNVIYVHKLANNNVNVAAYMRAGNLPGHYETQTYAPVTNITASVSASDVYVGIASTAGFNPNGGTALLKGPGTAFEYINYTGIAATSALIGVTRAKAGGSIVGTGTAGNNIISGITTTNIQVGQRVFSPYTGDNTYVSQILNTSQIAVSQALVASGAGVAITFVPMGGATAGLAFTYSATAPVVVEQAYPTFGPTIAHWGTAATMDGRFDNDKSLIFTYGQSAQTSIPTGQSKALFSIRCSPSCDNGTSAFFGQRELVNRMQLTLSTLDISVAGITTANVLIRAYLNAQPSTQTAWTNAVGNTGIATAANSSLAQIADYGGGNTTVTGGEVTGGFWVSGTGSVDLSNLRDLANSILGGGGAYSNSQIYPDGPDTLTIVATNYTPSTTVNLQGRISWTEAQA